MNFPLLNPQHWLSQRPWSPTQQPLPISWLLKLMTVLTVILALTAGYCWSGWQIAERRSEVYKQRWQKNQNQLDVRQEPR